MKRRFVQDPVTLDLIEVDPDFISVARNGDAALWNDRAYQDGGDPRFRSRTEHREFMRREGLTTIDDYTGEFARRAEERKRFLTEGYDPTRRAHVEDAYRRVVNGQGVKNRHG